MTPGAASYVRCPQCGGTFESSNECTYCGGGVRYANQGFLATRTELDCPRCDGTLREIVYRDTHIDVCPACGGSWFDMGELETMLQSTRSDARSGEFLPSPSSAENATTTPSGTAYVRCPKCGALMNRKNWERRSGVVLDWCPKHGLWLDAGEIAQLRAWAARTPDGPPVPPVERKPDRTKTSVMDRRSSTWAHRQYAPGESGTGFIDFLLKLFG